VTEPCGVSLGAVAEADGSQDEAARLRDELLSVLGEGALGTGTPSPAELWRWRDGLVFAVIAKRGGKLGEDIAVPLDRLAEAIDESVALGGRHGLEAVSWGHAGDGNLHTNFLLDPEDPEELARAERAGEELFELALRLGGTVSGEHGLGLLKRGHAGWTPRVTALQQAIKDAFDPKGLLNPGKKL